MNDVTIIDQFLNTFAAYIDSGFGLLRGEVAFLTATLIVIDMTIAGLYWAMSHATGQGEDVIAKLLRKVLYVGAFAYIINNFNWLASIVFRSFAGLGITATGSAITMENFLQPGRLAKTGIDAGAPILEQIGEMAGFPEVFVNLDPIVVMFLAWLVVVLCFFVLAIQLFITLIEFKLTTLAGFVLVPFALWNKTAFLAEKVLGNVVASGVKVLVLAVIVGIGSGLFAQFQVHPAEPSIDHALVIMLASLTLLALGIFGPGIATGLVSGAPQLGAGAMAGAAVGAAGTAVAIGAAATGVVAPWLLVRAWPRLPPSWPVAVRAPPRRRPAVRSRRSRPVPPPLAAQRRDGGPGQRRQDRRAGSRARCCIPRFRCRATHGRSLPRWLEWRCCRWRRGCGIRSGAAGEAASGAATAQTQEQPAWAKRLHRRQQLTHAATTTAHALRGGDGGGSGQGPSLRDSDS